MDPAEGTYGCPIGAVCFACRGTEDLRPIVAASPAGDLCWTACARCARGGVVLRLTGYAARRMILEHREHAAPL
ncbi:hypothetical protein [Pseudonocardia endophytica]|uniref:Uncharacterized protein n=1 Tax=Pseudonocardia endophytica TaxID=401976 RepID=A0A4V2PIP7_PSEEN|nr:hypothetical protein [Pseudonocardia endophytica]TCK25426.1 hypothetical protein EV378_1234 [Pseudonocardia endophytica]